MSEFQGCDHRALILPEAPVLGDRGLALAGLWDGEDLWRNGIRGFPHVTDVTGVTDVTDMTQLTLWLSPCRAMSLGMIPGVPDATGIAGHGPYSTRLGP